MRKNKCKKGIEHSRRDFTSERLVKKKTISFTGVKKEEVREKEIKFSWKRVPAEGMAIARSLRQDYF